MSRKQVQKNKEERGRRLMELLKERYGTRADGRPRYKEFISDLHIMAIQEKKDYYYRPTDLSKICHGGVFLKYDDAKDFSKVLNVPIEYLLCETDTRDFSEAKQDLLETKIATDAFYRGKSKRIIVFSAFINFMLSLGYLIDFILSDKCFTEAENNTENYYHCVNSPSGFRITGSCEYIISSDKFYDMMKDRRLSIKVNQTPEKYLYLNRVEIILDNKYSETFDVPSFFKKMSTSSEAFKGIINAQLKNNQFDLMEMFDNDDYTADCSTDINNTENGS